jgi:hypothetical protein
MLFHFEILVYYKLPSFVKCKCFIGILYMLIYVVFGEALCFVYLLGFILYLIQFGNQFADNVMC